MTSTPTPLNPDLDLEASIDSILAAGASGAVGDVLQYRFVATNVGDVSFAGPVRITDNIAFDELCPLVSTVGNRNTTLDPGEAIVCRATHALTESDLASGSVTNTATVTAGGFTSNTTSSTASVVRQSIQSSGNDVEEVDSELGDTFQSASNDLDFSEGYTIGLRYPVCIQSGSTIASATITFTADEFDGESPVTFADIWAERGSGEAFSSGNRLRSRSRTITSVPWSTSSIVNEWNPGTTYQTPALVSVVDEAINAASWPPAQGCGNLVFIIDSHGDGDYGSDYREGRGDREAVAFDNEGPYRTGTPALEVVVIEN